MTTTDHAIVAPAVTGDPGTRADAGGFDPGRPFRTRDGREVEVKSIENGWVDGFVNGWMYCWRPNGMLRSGASNMDLVNYDPATPDPIPQPEGDAPPAPAQSAGAAAGGEDDVAALLRSIIATVTSEVTMEHWDAWRAYIARGGKGSSPRDGFEALLSVIQCDAEDALRALARGADGEDDAAWLAASVFIDALWDYVEPHREEDYPRVKALSRQRDGAKAALRDALARHAARPHEPADASARSARGEDDAAEYPNVTQEHLEEIVATWHPVTDLHRVASELLHLRRRGAQPIEPVPHWHSDFDAAPKTGKCVLLRRGLSYVPYVGHWTVEHGWVRHDGRNPPEHQPTDWCPLPGDSERNAPHKPAAAAPTASASRDPEDDAWAWMHKRFTNVEAGQDPNDRDYGADDMVDAFMAGAARRATSAPAPDAGPVDDCPLCDGQDLECPVCAADEARKTAARARTPDAGKETGR